MSQTIEEFVQSKSKEKVKKKTRHFSLLLLSLLPEIQKYRAQGYTKKIIWEYLKSEGKIPDICYSWFSIFVASHERLKLNSDSTITKPFTEVSTVETSKTENRKGESGYEPRKSSYKEPQPFTVTTQRKSPEEYFSRKRKRELEKQT